MHILPLPRFSMEIFNTKTNSSVQDCKPSDCALGWEERSGKDVFAHFIPRPVLGTWEPSTLPNERFNRTAFSFSSINIHNHLVGRERAGTLMNVCRNLLPNTTRWVLRSTTGSSAARKLKVGFSLPLECKVMEKQHNLWFYYFLKTTEARFSFYLYRKCGRASLKAGSLRTQWEAAARREVSWHLRPRAARETHSSCLLAPSSNILPEVPPAP